MSEEQARGSPSPALVKPRQFCPVLSFGQRGSSAWMLNKPWGAAVNERDEIAVTDTGNHRVQVISRNGDKQGKLTRPRGEAFDKNNNIMVVDTLNSLV